jgi:hypothetical protein
MCFDKFNKDHTQACRTQLPVLAYQTKPVYIPVDLWE